jgi:predicted DNA-binding protein YlxM (UPF0122 family)
MELYYYDDLSLSEIAEHTQTTRQAVHDNIKRAEAYLIMLEDSLGCIQASNRLRDLLDGIDAQTQKLVSLSKDGSDEVYVIAANIAQFVENGKNFLMDL